MAQHDAAHRGGDPFPYPSPFVRGRAKKKDSMTPHGTVLSYKQRGQTALAVSMFRKVEIYRFFVFGIGRSAYIASNNPVKKALSSTLSTLSIFFAPSYGKEYSALGK